MISIIIPVYNGEKYIKSIVENLKRLNYEEYEAIFINDGSTDNTLQILQEVENQDKRVKVISQENAGVSAARNCGIKYAKGEYICFVDVDDEIDVNYLNIFMKYMLEEKVEVAFCDSTPIKKHIEVDNIEIKKYEKDELLNDFLYRKIQTGVWGMLVSKRILDENHLFFKEGYKYSEDLHMVWRIFNSVDKIIYIKSPLYIYKENVGSVMTKINSSRLDSMDLMIDLEKYFEENNPEFYEIFKQYGVARISWAVLWQVVHYLEYAEYEKFLKRYDFRSDLKKLITFSDLKVKLSSIIFLISKKLYYYVVKIITRNYRS